jgi:hypothetical protein
MSWYGGIEGRIRTAIVRLRTPAFFQLNYLDMASGEGLEPPVTGSVVRGLSS